MAVCGRTRFGGTPEDIANVLEPHVTKPLWIEYPEKFLSRVQPTKLGQHADVLAELSLLQPNLSFTQKDMVAAMVIAGSRVEKIRKFKWKEGELEIWQDACARRVRTLCRHCSQNMAKSAGSSWVKVVQKAIAEAKKRAKKETPQAEPPKQEYVFGYDAEAEVAWRCTTTDPEQKEYSTQLEAPEDSADTDPVRAIFEDGSTLDVDELLCGAFRSRKVATAKRTAPRVWERKHSETGQCIFIRHRPDRYPLLSIFLEKNQVMQVGVKVFPSNEEAEAFVIGIAEDFAAGKIAVAELYSTRDRRLVEMNLVQRKDVKAKSMPKPKVQGSEQPWASSFRKRRVTGKTEDDQAANPCTPIKRAKFLKAALLDEEVVDLSFFCDSDVHE